MPQLTLSRRTVLAPTPGLTGQQGPARKAVFGQPGDVLKVKSATLTGKVTWFKSTLMRGGKRIGSGYVISAALSGQPGAEKIFAGALAHG